MEKGVLILECIDKSDPGSEGRFLSHMFDIMDVSSQYVEIRTPDQFISLMACAPYEFIHITTHGCVSKPSEKFVGWWTPNGKVNQKNLGPLVGKLDSMVVVSTACKSATDEFGRYVVDVLGSRYYVAPTKSPRFYNAILFAHVFYHKYFVLDHSVEKGYKAYDQNYKNPHGFEIYRRKQRRRPNKGIQRITEKAGSR